MREKTMFRSAKNTTKRSEDVKKSAAKVLDTKKDTATRAKVIRKVFIQFGDLCLPFEQWLGQSENYTPSLQVLRIRRTFDRTRIRLRGPDPGP